MGAPQVDTEHVNLLNTVDYTNIKSLRRLYQQYRNLEKLAGMGNRAAVVVYCDLKIALEQGQLTSLQSKYLQEHLIEQCTLEELAEDHSCSTQNITHIIQGALHKIKKFLLEGGYTLGTVEADGRGREVLEQEGPVI